MAITRTISGQEISAIYNNFRSSLMNLLMTTTLLHMVLFWNNNDVMCNFQMSWDSLCPCTSTVNSIIALVDGHCWPAVKPPPNFNLRISDWAFHILASMAYSEICGFKTGDPTFIPICGSTSLLNRLEASTPVAVSLSPSYFVSKIDDSQLLFPSP
jgi:hypothetical protein